MLPTKFDLVDVGVSSTKPIVDAILEHPILDGTKKYSVECTEFVTALSEETPLPFIKTFEDAGLNMLLFQVRRKVVGVAAIQVNTELGTLLAPHGAVPLPTVGTLLAPHQIFAPTVFRPIRTPNDVAFYLQEMFDEIKKVYGTSVTGLVGNLHGGVPTILPADVLADSFVKIVLTPNGTIRFYFSALFCKHFFIVSSPYGVKLFGLDESTIAFRTVGAVVHTGIDALLDGTPVIVAGATGETIVYQCLYPLTRHFDHRVRLELDSAGMPVPAIIDWSTKNRQQIRHTLASFAINQISTSRIGLGTQGANEGDISLTTQMLLGSIVFRRAEDKVSERFEILSSQFFQNIRLEVFIVRREWNIINKEFDFKRRAIRLADGESWQAKLRFRTF
jgi:hypothetical protein